MFFVFYCYCALNYHAAANFWIGGRERFENGMLVVFGECGRECFSGPSNTGNCVRHIRGAIICKQNLPGTLPGRNIGLLCSCIVASASFLRGGGGGGGQKNFVKTVVEIW